MKKHLFASGFNTPPIRGVLKANYNKNYMGIKPTYNPFSTERRYSAAPLVRTLRRSSSLFFILFISLCSTLFSQEQLKSPEEEYYNFLSLQGLVERPTLNYRTLSDSVWTIGENEGHPWQNQNLGGRHPLFGDFSVKIYGPELLMSGNTAAPYGQNDGVLWQGRGFNALLKGGVRFEGYGIELTILPHFAFSQNAPFDIMPSAYESEFGYFWGYGVDAPQRFGNKPFFDWDFGDSEIRYTWKTLTIGFGTQAIWLGHSYLNSILHSNNAPAYPKFDIGLRRQNVTIPGLNWYIGDVEARFWVGRLTESDYFDGNASNNFRMFHGFSFAYAPSFLPGLSLFANRASIVDWEMENLKYIIPRKDTNANTEEDQKASLGFSWLFSQVGLEIYGEIGVDDYSDWIIHPFHSTVYSFGLNKTLIINKEKQIYGEIKLEANWMEMTQDFQLQWPYSFYFHHELIQGYTNRGQWLGNGLSPGGNSQFLGFDLYYPKGNSSAFISRNNPDNNFLYSKAIHSSPDEDLNLLYYGINRTNFNIGANTVYFFNSNIFFSGGIVYNLMINPKYAKKTIQGSKYVKDSVLIHNFYFNLGIKFLI